MSVLRILRPAMLCSVAACVALFVAAPAAADVYVAGYGSTTDTRTGQHGDLTVGANFTYSDADEDVRRVVVDTPAGGVGNPNAVPFEERCPPATFETGVCPASSQIGVVELDATVTVGVSQVPLSLTGTISIIQTVPEVPTTVGAYISPPVGSPVRSYAEFYPVTSGPNGDFRVRSVTAEFPRTVDAGPPFGVLPLVITRYQQLLWGVLPSGRQFITNPTRCETWMSYGYAQAYDSNTNADADPLESGSNEFVSSGEVPTTPDCSTTPAFPITAAATITTGARDQSPSLVTTLEVPGVSVGDPAPDAAKRIVATLPKAINADFMQLDRICPRAALATDSCPAKTRIGSARATTPLIAAGYTGDVYLTEADPGRALPDVAIKMHGPSSRIDFTVRGTNRYVNMTQLETTFDNLPQPGFFARRPDDRRWCHGSSQEHLVSDQPGPADRWIVQLPDHRIHRADSELGGSDELRRLLWNHEDQAHEVRQEEAERAGVLPLPSQRARGPAVRQRPQGSDQQALAVQVQQVGAQVPRRPKKADAAGRLQRRQGREEEHRLQSLLSGQRPRR